MEVPFIFGGFILLAIVCRVAADGMDRARIRQHIEGRGGRVISIEWRLFGPGWFGTQHARLYAVQYVDREGNQHDATCKTSMLAGVYWTDDRIVRHAPRPDSPDPHELEAENRRLREELDRMRSQQR
ncbi:MAG: hypothetical protein WDZ31_06375 [Phycisphaeraceae bacterium]